MSFVYCNDNTLINENKYNFFFLIYHKKPYNIDIENNSNLVKKKKTAWKKGCKKKCLVLPTDFSRARILRNKSRRIRFALGNFNYYSRRKIEWKLYFGPKNPVQYCCFSFPIVCVYIIYNTGYGFPVVHWPRLGWGCFCRSQE